MLFEASRDRLKEPIEGFLGRACHSFLWRAAANEYTDILRSHGGMVLALCLDQWLQC